MAKQEALYRRTVMMADMLPVLASHGLLLRVRFPSDLLRELHATDAPPTPAPAPAAHAASSSSAAGPSSSQGGAGGQNVGEDDLIAEAIRCGAKRADLLLLASTDRNALSARLRELGFKVGPRLQLEQRLIALACAQQTMQLALRLGE